MPNRGYSASAFYRYGLNGQEKSTELNENLYTAEYWEYDSRIVRRWNVDPKPNVSISSYSVFSNNPILNSDIKGDTITIKGSHKSSFTINTTLGTNTTINLKDYHIKFNFGGNKSISLSDLKPDAVGIDLGGAVNTPIGGGQVGVNLIWHFRGEKSGDALIPEIHTYAGGQFQVTSDASLNGNVGVILAWAKNADGTSASPSYVANGINWTGNFWGASINLGEAQYSGGLCYFTARDPFKLKSDAAWTGFTLAWTPALSKDAGFGKLGTILQKINSGTLGASLSKTYYWMMYGNGSDFLNATHKNVSGWHFLNPIDAPEDDHK